MPHDNPSESEIKEILANASTIAVVGASGNPDKPSYRVMKQLQRAGYRVVPVNPRESEILGERSYPSLIDVPEPVDIVDVFRRPEDTPSIADDAVTIGAKTLWLQTGVSSDDAAERAVKGGLSVVMDRCIGSTLTVLKIPPRSRA
jgi:predicted CoA-binding protein